MRASQKKWCSFCIKYRPSYSILHDEFYRHMTDHSYTGFDRGKEGSTVEHLTSLQYQIEKDKERLAKIESNIQKAKIKYEPVRGISKTYQARDNAGKKNPLTGNYSVTKDDYDQLTALAREGISSRVKIGELRAQVRHYQDDADRYKIAAKNPHACVWDESRFPFT